MWVRSQDDEILINLDNITAIRYSKIFEGIDNHGPIHALIACTDTSSTDGFELGRYFTSNRADEILEEIEDELEKDSNGIYYMPLE